MEEWKKQVIEKFDVSAENYAAYDKAQKRAAKMLADFLPDLGTNTKILELGCGTGNLTQHLIAKYPNAHLYISDTSQNMLRECREKYEGKHGKIKWQIIDGEDIKTDQKFDLIISSMSAQWFTDFDSAIAHQKQFLNKGGVLFMALPSKQTFQEWKESLEILNLPDGVLEFPKIPNPLHEEIFQTQFKSGLDFLRMIKETGAHTPKPEYKSLNVKDMKKAIHLFETKFKSTATWHIQIVKI